MGEITFFLLCQNQRLRSTNLTNDGFHCYLHEGGDGVVLALISSSKTCEHIFRGMLGKKREELMKCC